MRDLGGVGQAHVGGDLGWLDGGGGHAVWGTCGVDLDVDLGAGVGSDVLLVLEPASVSCGVLTGLGKIVALVGLHGGARADNLVLGCGILGPIDINAHTAQDHRLLGGIDSHAHLGQAQRLVRLDPHAQLDQHYGMARLVLPAQLVEIHRLIGLVPHAQPTQDHALH